LPKYLRRRSRVAVPSRRILSQAPGVLKRNRGARPSFLIAVAMPRQCSMSRSCGLLSHAPAPFLRQSEGGRRRRAHFLALGLAFLSFGAGSALARSTAGAVERGPEA